MTESGGSSANRSQASWASHLGQVFSRAAAAKNERERVTDAFKLQLILRPSGNLTRTKVSDDFTHNF